MLSEILLSLSAGLFFYLSYRYAYARPDKFPPGPPRMPIFGSYLIMMLSNFRFMHLAVLNFSKWYKSDIVGFFVGPHPVVAVHNPAAVKKVFNSVEYDGRPAGYIIKIRDPRFKPAGIFFTEGPDWKEQRRFMLRHMRDYGFGRRFQELELIIQEEITDMLDLMRNGPRYEHENAIGKKGGYRVIVPHIFGPYSGNSLFHVMFNERIPRSEQADLVKLTITAMKFQRASDDYGKLIGILPWIRHIFPNWSSYNTLMEANNLFFNFFADIVDRHMKTYHPGAERNFIDLYISEMRMQAKYNQHSSFCREQFVLGIIDFAFPAVSAFTGQMSHVMTHLLLYPDVQKRVQKEIDDVVGSGRLPTLEDRKNLHYTEATIREIMRIFPLLPSSVPHKTVVDTELMGYKIPKDTIVVPSIYAYHLSEDVWGDPHNFRPERFLDEEGKLSLKKDTSMPFGAGKRLCAGETFGRNMVFLQTTAMLQNFNIVLGPGDKLIDPSKYHSGFIVVPPDFWIQLEERK